MSFPLDRPRRLRRREVFRRMVRETVVSVNDLIYPLFAVHGAGVSQEISSMPGVVQQSVDLLIKDAHEAAALGIPAVILFGIPAHKDATGSEASDDDGIIPRAVRALKEQVPELAVITDVCLCEYTDHGHCGVVEDGAVQNDPTVERLVAEALAHARAGADIVAPSDMMDGRVGAIRRALDADGFVDTVIMAYAAKYASGFYGPFREVVQSIPQFGDRRGYQMDPANAEEALREVALDLEEGADIVMVKPAMPYLDIIRRVKDTFHRPLAAYQVSGEYAMLKAASRAGWLDEDRVAIESLTAIKRAGADLIITYYAKEAARWLRHTGGVLP
ncbi:MAG: porphobilinogen synthase [Nitrospirae bacterium]|nr:porphobilinogen synthase [Nitrospirota bacterium]